MQPTPQPRRDVQQAETVQHDQVALSLAERYASVTWCIDLFHQHQNWPVSAEAMANKCKGH